MIDTLLTILPSTSSTHSQSEVRFNESTFTLFTHCTQIINSSSISLLCFFTVFPSLFIQFDFLLLSYHPIQSFSFFYSFSLISSITHSLINIIPSQQSLFFIRDQSHSLHYLYTSHNHSIVSYSLFLLIHSYEHHFHSF